MRLLAENTLSVSDVQVDSLAPTYRRASLNMSLATLCCEKTLRELPPDIDKDQLSFVVATHFGEVSTTLEFLNTYRETQTPRPILFQNSLHNSTLGFASIQLGITGPAMTVSCDVDTERAALDISETLLELTPYVLLCFVDCIPQALRDHYVNTFPFLEKHLNRAHSLLYARN
jgi:hypothetical protein